LFCPKPNIVLQAGAKAQYSFYAHCPSVGQPIAKPLLAVVLVVFNELLLIKKGQLRPIKNGIV
jgi:hypothetical protein